jgi:hypothetical protein
MTSQIARIKNQFKAFGFCANDIRANVIKNKYGENIDTSIRLNERGYRGSELRDKVARQASQIAKSGFNLDIHFYNGRLLYVGISEAKYGRRGVIDYGQRRIRIEKWIKEDNKQEEG